MPVLTSVCPSTIVVNSVVKTLTEVETRGVDLVTGAVIRVVVGGGLEVGVLSDDRDCDLLDGGGLDVCEGGSVEGGGVDEGGGGGGVEDGGGFEERDEGGGGGGAVEVGVVPVPACRLSP